MVHSSSENWTFKPIGDTSNWSDEDDAAFESERAIITDRVYRHLCDVARTNGFVLLDPHEGFDGICRAAVDNETAKLFDAYHDYGSGDADGRIVFQVRENVTSALYQLEDEGRIEWVIRDGWPWISVPESTKGNRLDRIEELRTMPYREYLWTPEWRERRQLHLQHAGHRCQACNREGQLHVHHRTYANRGNERFTDLIVLCSGCHEHFHERFRIVQ